jgi:uncharacterized RDD family membrane protein YckC
MSTEQQPVAAPTISPAFGARGAAHSGPAFAPYAGFVSRAMAMVIDLLIIAGIVVTGGTAFNFFWNTSGITWVIGRLTARFLWLQPVVVFLNSATFILIVILALAFLYFTFFYSLGGATIGKYVMGLRVVTADGRRLHPRRAALRTLAYSVSSLALYLGFLAVLADDRRRGWHDRIARTAVVYKWQAEPEEADGIQIAERPG